MRTTTEILVGLDAEIAEANQQISTLTAERDQAIAERDQANSSSGQGMADLQAQVSALQAAAEITTLMLSTVRTLASQHYGQVAQELGAGSPLEVGALGIVRALE